MITEIKLDDYIKNNFILFLSILVISSISIRLFFLPFETPFKTDAIDYLIFALETSKTNQFPIGILKTNDGWPLFLSPLFSIIETSDIMTFVNVQRITSIVISSLTIIPIYFLCKKFVSSKYAIIGAGSVVTKDVPPYTLVLGNPARIVGKVDKKGNLIK